MKQTVLKQTSFPEAKIFVYKLNHETKYYQKQSGEIGFTKLPYELKLEETQQKEQIRSKWVCRGRTVNGKYTFFTGLLPVGNGNLFFGDHYEIVKGQKRNSFILFQFSDGNEVMTLHFFNHFKLYPERRGKFITQYLQQKKGGD